MPPFFIQLSGKYQHATFKSRIPPNDCFNLVFPFAVKFAVIAALLWCNLQARSSGWKCNSGEWQHSLRLTGVNPKKIGCTADRNV